MKNSDNFYYLIKRFFVYYRLPLSVVNKEGKTLYCFPEEASPYILPSELVKTELALSMDNAVDAYTPFLTGTPHNSFIAVVPLPSENYVVVGPAFSQPFSLTESDSVINSVWSKSEFARIRKLSFTLPLVDESYLADALSMLVLLIHYKEIAPDEILSANHLTKRVKTFFESSNIYESDYEILLQFEAELQSYIREGQIQSLKKIWDAFAVSIRNDFNEYMYAEHHFMIPLLNSAKQAAIEGGALKEEVVTVFHSTISRISPGGSLSVNLRTVERATYEMCNLVIQNKVVPFRADLCIKCEQYIDEHFGEKITAAQIAAYCGVDRSLIFDLFRKNYNISLNEYINEAKLRKATVLLRHTDMPISEIASSLGYCSTAYFSKSFREQLGCKPTEYRLGRK